MTARREFIQSFFAELKGRAAIVFVASAAVLVALVRPASVAGALTLAWPAFLITITWTYWSMTRRVRRERAHREYLARRDVAVQRVIDDERPDDPSDVRFVDAMRETYAKKRNGLTGTFAFFTFASLFNRFDALDAAGPILVMTAFILGYFLLESGNHLFEVRRRLRRENVEFAAIRLAGSERFDGVEPTLLDRMRVVVRNSMGMFVPTGALLGALCLAIGLADPVIGLLTFVLIGPLFAAAALFLVLRDAMGHDQDVLAEARAQVAYREAVGDRAQLAGALAPAVDVEEGGHLSVSATSTGGLALSEEARDDVTLGLEEPDTIEEVDERADEPAEHSA